MGRFTRLGATLGALSLAGLLGGSCSGEEHQEQVGKFKRIGIYGSITGSKINYKLGSDGNNEVCSDLMLDVFSTAERLDQGYHGGNNNPHDIFYVCLDLGHNLLSLKPGDGVGVMLSESSFSQILHVPAGIGQTGHYLIRIGEGISPVRGRLESYTPK